MDDAPLTNPGMDIPDPAGQDSGSDLSRRRFLSSLGLTAAASLSLGGCFGRCSSGRTSGPTVTPGHTPSAPGRPVLPDREPMVRVRIDRIRPGNKVRSSGRISLDCPTRWIRVREADGRRHGLAERAPVSVERDGPEWIISDAAGRQTLVDGSRPVELAADETEAAGSLIYDGREYPGLMRVVAQTSDSNRDFDLVSSVPMERYLPGVLEGELFSHWRPATFAAQAVAARSFACSEIHTFVRRHYDVTATQQSQMYGGEGRLDVAMAAVQRTRGVVLSWDGAIVPGYYSSCCGGIAANASDAIGPNPVNDIPPLQSRALPDACGSAPLYEWDATQGVDELTRRFNAWGLHNNNRPMRLLSRVRSIEPVQLNDHGRPKVYLVAGVADEMIELPASRLTSAVNHAGMGLHSPRSPLRSSFVGTSISGETIRFDGRGFGHGVGLCQYGAQALAKGRSDYREILDAYYPQSRLVGAYM